MIAALLVATLTTVCDSPAVTDYVLRDLKAQRIVRTEASGNPWFTHCRVIAIRHGRTITATYWTKVEDNKLLIGRY